MTVDLSEQEWAQVMFVLANAEGKGITWAMVNPILMKIGQQLQPGKPIAPPPPRPPAEVPRPKRRNADGQEVSHE
jgi:hypothetical protein